jgi:hypothetical protein
MTYFSSNLVPLILLILNSIIKWLKCGKSRRKMSWIYYYCTYIPSAYSWTFYIYKIIHNPDLTQALTRVVDSDLCPTYYFCTSFTPNWIRIRSPVSVSGSCPRSLNPSPIQHGQILPDPELWFINSVHAGTK